MHVMLVGTSECMKKEKGKRVRVRVSVKITLWAPNMMKDWAVDDGQLYSSLGRVRPFSLG